VLEKDNALPPQGYRISSLVLSMTTSTMFTGSLRVCAISAGVVLEATMRTIWRASDLVGDYGWWG
jgi:hypothetical protein